MIGFVTRTGSTYEVDQKTQLIRRLNGNGKPTQRMGEGWKKYRTISDIVVGRSVFIVWYDDVDPPASKGSTPGTITSAVERVLGDIN